jgi:hypothetical protein
MSFLNSARPATTYLLQPSVATQFLAFRIRSGYSHDLLLYFFDGISRAWFRIWSAGRPERRKAAVFIFTAGTDAVRGGAAALLG